MYRQKFIVSLFAVAAVFLAGAGAAAAQTAPVRGKVELVKADNTRVPVAEAVVSAYRTDTSKGKLPSAKTDKKGFFNFAGVPFAQTFVLVVTAPNIKAGYYPNVKANMENILIEVVEGDGVVPTEEQVRQVLASAMAAAGSGGGQMSAEEKKKQEEIAKQNAEITARNEKIKRSNEVVNRAIEEGKKAYDAGDLDTAVTKFDEGYQADPEFAGTAPVFLNNKADVLKQRAVNNYKKSLTDAANKATLLEAAKKDFQESVIASQKAFEILKTANATEPNVQKSYEANKTVALSIMTDSYRLMLETRAADEAKAAEAIKAMDEYLLVETDAAKKLKAQTLMADALRKVGKSGMAVPIYKRLYEAAPDNPDVLAGLGLSLFDSGVVAGDKAQMQEGLNIMQRFAEVAPDTHALKESVKGAVDYLKTQEKLTPQKTTRPASSTKKRT